MAPKGSFIFPKLIIVVISLSTIGFFLWFSLDEKEDERRTTCIKRLHELNEFLESTDASGKNIDAILIFPKSIQARSPSEQIQFVRKALRNELSEEGINLLAERGELSSLAESHPSFGKSWTKSAGVDLKDCFALSIKHADVEALAVIHFPKDNSAKLIRIDNVHHAILQINK